MYFSYYKLNGIINVFIVSITNSDLTDTAQQLEKLRDEVKALSFLVTDKLQLQNECNKIQKEIERLQQEEKKYRKLTNQCCKKLIQHSIQLTDKAAFAQNNSLSEKLQGLSSTTNSNGDSEIQQNVSSPQLSAYQQYEVDILEPIPEASSVLTNEIDPESVWKLQSNSTSRLHAKMKKIRSEHKFLSRSFSMQDL